MPYDIVISEECLDKTEAYKQALISGEIQFGPKSLLKKVLIEHDLMVAVVSDVCDVDADSNTIEYQINANKLRHYNAGNFLNLLLKTKKPVICAEYEPVNDNAQWNNEELSILGDVGCTISTKIYNDGTWGRGFTNHENPIDGYLGFVCGSLLSQRYNKGSITSDQLEITYSENENLELDRNGFDWQNHFYGALLKYLAKVNENYEDHKKYGIIRIPRALIESFSAARKEYFLAALRFVLTENISSFSHIKSDLVVLEGFNESEDDEIETINIDDSSHIRLLKLARDNEEKVESVKQLMMYDHETSENADLEKAYQATLDQLELGFTSPLDSYQLAVIHQERFNALIKRRLLPQLLNANRIAAQKRDKKAVFVVPGLGCGVFGGPLYNVGRTEEIKYALSIALKTILSEHQHKLANIGFVHFDPNSEINDEEHSFGNITYRARAKANEDNRPAHLAQPADFSVGDDGISNDSHFLYTCVAWDHFSFPGNDWLGGSRHTDDGVKGASTDVLYHLTGFRGIYNPKDGGYHPPKKFFSKKGYSNWENFIESKRIKFQANRDNRLLVTKHDISPEVSLGEYNLHYGYHSGAVMQRANHVVDIDSSSTTDMPTDGNIFYDLHRRFIDKQFWAGNKDKQLIEFSQIISSLILYQALNGDLSGIDWDSADSCEQQPGEFWIFKTKNRTYFDLRDSISQANPESLNRSLTQYKNYLKAISESREKPEGFDDHKHIKRHRKVYTAVYTETFAQSYQPGTRSSAHSASASR